MPRRPRREAGMAFILITLFLDILGLGIIIPVLPELVTDFLDGDASRAAAWFGAIASSFALMQFFFAPVLGALSDRFGRRPVILISLFGFGVNYLLLAFAPSLLWLFVARILSGITGASMTTANAYIADISTDETRARNFGLVGAMFGLGFICGPALGGVLGELGPRVPFFASAGVVLVNWVYGLAVLPESLPPDKRRKVTWRDANPLGGLRLLGRYPLVAGLAVAFVFMSLSQRGMETIWVLYTHYRYGWEEFENGMTLALFGVAAIVVQGLLVRRVVARVGERRAVLIGMGFSALGMVLFGLASLPWMMVATIAISALGGIAGPSIQALVTGSIRPDEQGGVQGTLTSLISLTAIFAPLISTQLFRRFTGDGALVELPGAPFFASTAFLLVSVMLIIAAFRRHPAA